MSQSHDTRLAILEREMEELKRQYNIDMFDVKRDLKDILGKFNQMTGGQKAWFGLAALLGSILGACVAFVSLIINRHH